tara:strand:+ start:544 stop:1005 length:462 start_codon:yes stop_codon:yes gene_type:complete
MATPFDQRAFIEHVRNNRDYSEETFEKMIFMLEGYLPSERRFKECPKCHHKAHNNKQLVCKNCYHRFRQANPYGPRCRSQQQHSNPDGSLANQKDCPACGANTADSSTTIVNLKCGCSYHEECILARAQKQNAFFHRCHCPNGEKFPNYYFIK